MYVGYTVVDKKKTRTAHDSAVCDHVDRKWNVSDNI